jgi:hypothetical protein
VLATIKARPGNAGGRWTFGTTADLDGACARRPNVMAGRDEGTAARSNKGTALCIGAGD